jgi:hypothetical protein
LHYLYELICYREMAPNGILMFQLLDTTEQRPLLEEHDPTFFVVEMWRLPELFIGHHRFLGNASDTDLYAFGVVLYRTRSL